MMALLQTSLAAAASVALLLFPGQTLAAAAAAATTQCNENGSRHDQHQQQPTAQEVVAKLGLAPNVEGGYYLETFRDDALIPGTNRSVSSEIYYLLEGPNVPSVWHRVDATEVWHWYAGAPMILQLSSDNGTPTRNNSLGNDLFAEQEQRPQLVIPGNTWQRAISCGLWTLVGNTVAPAFVPEGYELAPEGWEPNDGA